MFLSSRSVRELIERGLIKIEYAYIPNGEGFSRATAGMVDLSDADASATKLFLSNSSGTRLQLTVGPLARSHNSFTFAGRLTLEDTPDIVNIAQAGSMTIEPRETVTVLTNEYTEFDDGYAGLVTPRVTMTDAGFLLTSAYIDPGYKGLLRVTLHNATDLRQTLKICEPIAQLFIYKVAGEVDLDNQARLLERSVFYGTNWKRVLDDQVDPFPRRKIPVRAQGSIARAVNMWRAAKSSSLSVLKSVVALGYVGMLIAALIGYGKFQQQLESIDRLQAELTRVRTNSPLVGTTTIDFERGKASVRVPLPHDVAPNSTILTNITGVEVATVTSTSFLHAQGRTYLEVIVKIPNTSRSPHRGELAWAILQ